MLVISITDCPASLKGDLTKWLFEVNVGVYVGQVSARVRDELWKRIVDNVKVGRVTMVYQTNSEQRVAFRVHNSKWQPIDFDGLMLMMRPTDGGDDRVNTSLQPGFSKAAQRRKVQRIKQAEANRTYEEKFPERSAVSAIDLHQETSKHTKAERKERICIDNANEDPMHCNSNNKKLINTHSIEYIKDKKISYIDTQNSAIECTKEKSEKLSIEQKNVSDTALIKKYLNKNTRKQEDIINKDTKDTPIRQTPKDITANAVKDGCSYPPKASFDTRYPTDCCIIDIETTGLKENENEIIELGALRIRDGKIAETFQSLVKPIKSIPAFITKLTGITNAMTKQHGFPLSEAMDNFITFIGQDMIIGHNVSFDIKFINAALTQMHRKKIENSVLCTLELAKKKVPHQKSYKLSALIEHFAIEASGAHRSTADCESVYKLYILLIGAHRKP